MLQTFYDQLNRPVTISFPPRRIVSVVPSQTELLYALGLREEVVGITKFCVHPGKWLREKKRIGGTKNLRISSILQLDPDLIIANKEENEKGQIRDLENDIPVWISDIQTLDHALEMIAEVGKITGREEAGARLAGQIAQKFKMLEPFRERIPAAYFIWKNPYMVAAGNTFIHEMLAAAGFQNVFQDRQRYPEIQPKELKKRAPAVILLSSEPFPFSEKHYEEFKAICPHAVIKVVDGELFSWYGSRLLRAPDYFQHIHEEINNLLKS